jgi:hypothetical protein
MVWFNARLTRQNYYQIPSDAVGNAGPGSDMYADIDKTMAILRKELS